MGKKYLIANMHTDKEVCKQTEYLVSWLYKQNEKLVCLLEGIPSGEITPPISPDTADFYQKIDIYQKLLNSWFDNKLTNTQQEDLLTIFGQDRLLNMPLFKLLITIKSLMPHKGIEDERRLDGEDEEVLNDEDAAPSVNTFKEFVEEVFSDISAEDYERDALLYKNIKNYPGECIVIIGFTHIINWLQKGLLNEDYIIICPGLDISYIKNAVDHYNKIFKTSIQYDEQLAQKVYNELSNIKGVQYIDLKGCLPGDNQNNLYLNPEDNMSEVIGKLGLDHD